MKWIFANFNQQERVVLWKFNEKGTAVENEFPIRRNKNTNVSTT